MRQTIPETAAINIANPIGTNIHGGINPLELSIAIIIAKIKYTMEKNEAKYPAH
jgi:hypothetical protein